MHQEIKGYPFELKSELVRSAALETKSLFAKPFLAAEISLTRPGDASSSIAFRLTGGLVPLIYQIADRMAKVGGFTSRRDADVDGVEQAIANDCLSVVLKGVGSSSARLAFFERRQS
jgi:hypothetical protein